MALKFNRGAPTNGTSEIQRLTFGGTPSGGTFKLKFRGRTTASITWSSTNNTLRDNVDAALEALSSIGADNVTVAVGTMTAGIGFLTITFAGDLAKLDVPPIAVALNSLTGSSPTLAVTTTTAGVTATRRNASDGDVLADTLNGAAYLNTGTAPVAQWTTLPIAQGAHVADVSGTAGDVDPEARTAIATILDRLEAAGILAAS
jgi:hypothetical protein